MKRRQSPVIDLVPIEVEEKVIEQELAEIGTLLYRFFRQTDSRCEADSPRLPSHCTGTP